MRKKQPIQLQIMVKYAIALKNDAINVQNDAIPTKNDAINLQNSAIPAKDRARVERKQPIQLQIMVKYAIALNNDAINVQNDAIPTKNIAINS